MGARPNHKTDKIITTELLARIEQRFHSGNQVIQASIDYKKDGRPRGYYLCVRTFRDLDDGGRLHALFADPYKSILLLPAQAFNAARLAGLQAPQDLIDQTIAEVKTQWQATRDKEKQRELQAV